MRQEKGRRSCINLPHTATPPTTLRMLSKNCGGGWDRFEALRDMVRAWQIMLIFLTLCYASNAHLLNIYARLLCSILCSQCMW